MLVHAVEFAGAGAVSVVRDEVPAPGPDDLLVRVTWSGISAGSELLAYRGQLDPEWPLDERLGALAGTFRYPFRYGYSCVGRVEQAAGGVPVGTRVFAFHPHQDRLVVPAREVVPLPAGVTDRCATLFPLVETALQLALDAGPRFGETVVVSGLGTLGTLTALLLERSGARVLAGEPRPWRRRLAGELGLHAVPPDELPAAVAEATGGRGSPLALELSGVPSVLADLLPLLAHEGSVLVGSWYGARAVPLPLGAQFHRRRLAIRSSQVSTVPAALSGRWDIGRRRTVTAGLLPTLPLDALATTEFAFRDAPAAYRALDRAEPGVMHVALRYPQANGSPPVAEDQARRYQ